MIIATAGHVDHGKTSLVRQLTGVDTDRLEEEQRRGLSINLGFAYLPVGAQASLGFVDVPGHTRFINTMIAGVGGIDLGMLVVAADDGIMPQTREHLDVMRLLGIRRYIAVLTKVDRVEAARVEAVSGAVSNLLFPEDNGTILAVSNTSGAGIDALRSELEKRALAHRRRAAAGHFRLSVDRAFHLKGTGLVLTGTALAGTVCVGDELQLLPTGIPLRVRSLHVNADPARRGHAGQRCALNVSGGLHRDQVHRGDLLTADPRAPVSERLDARVNLLTDAPFALKHLSPVTLHIGAGRVSARLYLLEQSAGKRLTPGSSALAQLILERPLPCCRGDRFLLRDDSESFTLGGGTVLDPMAPRAGKARDERLRFLAAMSEDTPRSALRSLLDHATAPLNLSTFCAAWNLQPEQQRQLAEESAARCFVLDGNEYALAEKHWTALGQKIRAFMRDWHRDNPGQKGIIATEIRDQFESIAPGPLFRDALSELLQAGDLALTDGLIRLRDHRPVIPEAKQRRWQRLVDVFEARGLRLPLLSELIESSGMDRRQVLADLRSAVRGGRAVKLNDNRYALTRHMAEHAAIVEELARGDGSVTVIDYRDRIDSGRRLAIEILEYFDDKGFTRRLGEKRVIVNHDLPAALYSK